jgi:hypothetical protein
VFPAADRVRPAPKGPIAERIRAALDKPVRLAPKGEKVEFNRAIEVFKKEAGLDVPVRNNLVIRPIASEGEELPVGAWLQMFADEQLAGGGSGPVLLVRDYGILITNKEAAPPDAMTISELWKMPLKKEEPKPKEPAGGGAKR